MVNRIQPDEIRIYTPMLPLYEFIVVYTAYFKQLGVMINQTHLGVVSFRHYGSSHLCC